jgi:hypothetical protein
MTETSMTLIDLLRRAQWDTQVKESDYPMLALVGQSRGLFRRDLHGCLSLTEAGQKAIAEAQP